MTNRSFQLQSPFRSAVAADIDEVLPLAMSTVPGFVETLWSRLAEGTESSLDFGRRAQLAFITEGNTVVVEQSGTVAGMLICYPMAQRPNPHVPGMDEMLVPLMKLFSRVGGTWYLHGIATDPEYNGRGYGSQLMQIAESQARAAGKSALSLLVVDTNRSAIQFYEKRGYQVTASEPVVRMGWTTDAREWLLMEKSLADAPSDRSRA